MVTEKVSNCPCCGNSGGRVLFDARDFDTGKHPYQLWACAECGLARTEPKPSPEQLRTAYEPAYYGNRTQKFVGVVEYWTRLAARQRARGLVAGVTSGQRKLRVLDFGCGRGVLIDAFRSLGHEVVGVERSDSPFRDTNSILCGELVELDLRPESFDLIVLWHVLEHLESPAATLQQLCGLLRSDGHLVISVPNFGGAQSRLFRRNWFHLDLPRHLVHFDERSLVGIVERSGFNYHARHASSPDQSLFGFVQSALNSVPSFSSNHFYRLLQRRESLSDAAKLFAYLPLVALLLVPAFVELAIAAIRRTGATLTISARKPQA